MTQSLTDELFAAFEEKFPDRVHRSKQLVFRGTPGHIYFLPSEPSYGQLAKITQQSDHAEAALIRINDSYIVRLGSRHMARAKLVLPRRSDAIQAFRWIAHTHPLEQNNRFQAIAGGATEADRRTLAEVAREWGQTKSDVIVWGKVVRVRPFHHVGVH